MIEHRLKKGYDINLAGKTNKVLVQAERPSLFAMQPPDFRGLKPRLEVDIDSYVKIGTSLFYDKQNPDVKFLSPASGKVVQINRGERRAIIEVVVESGDNEDYEFFGAWNKNDIANLSKGEVIRHLLNGGLWPCIRQRPFSKVARQENAPRDIFVCAMDTAPLAPDYGLLIDGQEEFFEAGISVLSKLTEGKVYLNFSGKNKSVASIFEKVEGIEKHSFTGKHPAGNVSVHIHHIHAISSGEVIWYIYAPDVILIGRLFLEGKYPNERIVAVAGSSVKDEARKYYKTWLGASVQSLVNEGNLQDENVRYISGNVLTGRRIHEGGYVGFYDRLLTVIPDHKKRELFGWLTPGLKEESFSRLFLSKLLPSKEFIKDTRIHGGKRAFVQTGEYEKVLPMDILPVHLVKSIMAEEIEDMISLGLLEVDDEDFALCSYICPSKIDFGEYIRKGLDVLEKEG
jgi:Na+-transporting NADH:ubiquinone oxidoreductase subunit A